MRGLMTEILFISLCQCWSFKEGKGARNDVRRNTWVHLEMFSSPCVALQLMYSTISVGRRWTLGCLRKWCGPASDARYNSVVTSVDNITWNIPCLCHIRQSWHWPRYSSSPLQPLEGSFLVARETLSQPQSWWCAFLLPRQHLSVDLPPHSRQWTFLKYQYEIWKKKFKSSRDARHLCLRENNCDVAS